MKYEVVLAMNYGELRTGGTGTVEMVVSSVDLDEVLAHARSGNVPVYYAVDGETRTMWPVPAR